MQRFSPRGGLYAAQVEIRTLAFYANIDHAMKISRDDKQLSRNKTSQALIWKRRYENITERVESSEITSIF